MARCQVMGVTSSVRKWFEPVMTRARQISLQRPITTALAVFATEADARLATVTYTRQTRRLSPGTWPLSCDPFSRSGCLGQHQDFGYRHSYSISPCSCGSASRTAIANRLSCGGASMCSPPFNNQFHFVVTEAAPAGELLAKVRG
jgi:hypothetical protein